MFCPKVRRFPAVVETHTGSGHSRLIMGVNVSVSVNRCEYCLLSLNVAL